MDLSLKLCTTTTLPAVWKDRDRDRDIDIDLSSKPSTTTTSMDRDMDLISKLSTTTTSLEMDSDMDLDKDVDLSLKLCTSTTHKDRVTGLDIGKGLKPCTTGSLLLQSNTSESGSLLVDRLTTLPLELLIRILSLLPTKDAAATCVLSKKMMMRVFPCLTTLDLNDSSISHCLKHPYGIERFPFFVTFVDSVLRKHESQCLTRFRLGVATYYNASSHQYCGHQTQVRQYGEGCLPDLNSMQINAWISFPLTHSGLRELDLCIWVRGKSDDYQLAPEIFACESLEVLKLDTNLGFDRASTMSSFRLPKLKLFFLVSGAILPEDDFLTRLVSSCPLLEDLTVKGRCFNPKFTSISSPSLRRMSLNLDNVAPFSAVSNPDFVLINTPNLEYLKYTDSLANQYFITKMDRLVKAIICEVCAFDVIPSEGSFHKMLSLIRALSNVQHLALDEACTELLDWAELKDQLPLFPKLKCLELAHYRHYDKLLLPFLHCSPALETLIFPRALTYFGHNPEREFTKNNLERRFFCTFLAIIPLCCRHHLKRIEIRVCYGYERDIYLIQFLLRHALVLEELVITPYSVAGVTADQIVKLKSLLSYLPRAASVKCSILWNKTHSFDNPFPTDTRRSLATRRTSSI